MKILIGIMFCALMVSPTISSIHAQSIEDAEVLFNEAKIPFSSGNYNDAIRIYDEILEDFPDNKSTLKMKGIALSNSGSHQQSLKQFYKIHQSDKSDILALVGLGVGFGNLGEYQESKYYFEQALSLDPNNIVIQNYLDFVLEVLGKYPYSPTEKPQELQKNIKIEIPTWIKPIAKWWSEGEIEDSEFIDAIGFLISNRIMEIPETSLKQAETKAIPLWIKDRSEWWADDQIPDSDFVSGIHYMIENGIISVNIPIDLEEIRKQNAIEFTAFERYLNKISNNISKEKRYIEYPNPSNDVIKKFLRDYVKWNFEQEAQSASEKFPDPTYQVTNNTYTINYKVFVNEQPSGLPLDHVSTLNDSLRFWEEQDLSVNGQKANVKFEYTGQKHEANIWVTWVVRDLGEGVLGHAHLGKGVVEVTLGDYSCDGSFQLYDVATVQKIMTHELGHSVGLQHVTEPENIMYPSMEPDYAYCLLN